MEFKRYVIIKEQLWNTINFYDGWNLKNIFNEREQLEEEKKGGADVKECSNIYHYQHGVCQDHNFWIKTIIDIRCDVIGSTWLDTKLNQ